MSWVAGDAHIDALTDAQWHSHSAPFTANSDRRRRFRADHGQSQAIANAAQISAIRALDNEPMRSTSRPVDTDSTESRLTAQ